jgi:diadenosine tetraphosphate (Ap4A) HIT family hydrolase
VNTSRVEQQCRLCAIAKGRHAFGCDAPVMVDPDYFGLASIGGFIPGWSLVCPREHRHNLASEYSSAKLHRAISVVVDAVAVDFGEAAIFEHGSIRDGSPTACGTSHAHVHVVPFTAALADLAVSAELSLEWESVHLHDVAVVSGGREYLFVANRYEGPATTGYLACLAEPRSQYFRRLLAAQLGVPHLGDYRVAPLEDLSISTAMRVRAAVERVSRRAA